MDVAAVLQQPLVATVPKALLQLRQHMWSAASRVLLLLVFS
jgi:hypothetical protein